MIPNETMAGSDAVADAAGKTTWSIKTDVSPTTEWNKTTTNIDTNWVNQS